LDKSLRSPSPPRLISLGQMSLLSPRLQLRVAQKQILTPGLVQMVTVLQLNRLELREMITQEIAENPVLEESTDEAARSSAPRKSSSFSKPSAWPSRPINRLLEAPTGTWKSLPACSPIVEAEPPADWGAPAAEGCRDRRAGRSRRTPRERRVAPKAGDDQDQGQPARLPSIHCRVNPASPQRREGETASHARTASARMRSVPSATISVPPIPAPTMAGINHPRRSSVRMDTKGIAFRSKRLYTVADETPIFKH